MQLFRLAFVLALFEPSAGVAETLVHMPSVGFRYTTQVDITSALTSGANAKNQSVLRHEVVSSDGTTIETHDEATINSSAGEVAFSSRTTYRLFFMTATEATVREAPDQPLVTNSTSWDCPWNELDQFYPHGTAAQVSLVCKLTGKLHGQPFGPEQLTVNLFNLDDARVTTPAGTFGVREIVVRFNGREPGVTNEFTYDFAPELGISVVQSLKISAPDHESVTHSEVTDITRTQ